MVISALRMSALYMRFNWVVILQIAHLSSFIQLLQKVLSVRVMF